MRAFSTGVLTLAVLCATPPEGFQAAPPQTQDPQATSSATSVASDSATRAPRLSDADEARARGLEGRLKCPVCRTQSVLESTSFMALEMRAKIRELIAAGRTDGEILDYFADRYGDYILLEPRKTGFALSAYLLPALAMLAGGAAIVTVLARRRSGTRATSAEQSGREESGAARGEAPATGPEAQISPAERTRIEEELERYTV
jgi:cytochrome c-type biogenesis protein CcmH